MSDEINTSEMSRKVADPGFVACSVMCYLGIQGAVLRVGLEMYLSAVWEGYRSALPEEKAKREMRTFYDETFVQGFRVSKILKNILTFAVKNELPLKVQKVIPKRVFAKNKRIQKIRNQLLKYLTKKIAKKASLIVAEQVLRKAVLVADLAVAGGCVAKCSVEKFARDVGKVYHKTISDFPNAYCATLGIVEGVTQGFARDVIFRPMEEAKFSMDTTNWRFSERNEVHLDFHVISKLLWTNKIRNLGIDDFLTFMPKKLPDIPQFKKSSLDGIAKTLSKDGESEPAMRKRLDKFTYLEFIRYLVDTKVIQFVRSPQDTVDQWYEYY